MKQTGWKGYVNWNGEMWLADSEEQDGFSSFWKVKQVLHKEQSEFQEVSVIETVGFGRALVLDGVIQTTERDAYIYNEMITHVPLATHPHPRKVCLIGGGDCGAAREVVKYPTVERVDMVEIDPKVVEVSRQYLPTVAGEGESDPRIRFIYEDGAAYIRAHKDEYDVVIVDSSDPVGPAAVLFEEPFYRDVYAALKSDGLMVCQSESPVFYPHVLKRVRDTLQSMYPVVRTYLATVPTYPGGIWSFTLASKQADPLQAPPERLREEETKYVNRDIFRSCFFLPNDVRKIMEAG